MRSLKTALKLEMKKCQDKRVENAIKTHKLVIASKIPNNLKMLLRN